MNPLVFTVVQIALGILIVLLLPCAYRAVIGPGPADRLQAVETTTTLLIGIIILLMLLQDSALVIDVGVALAAFGFIATLAIARYLSEGRVF
ncbi:MAG: monovalent cation/H+ antiporter complex subunit F [Anaerolineae bacterium]|jgi:multicomponent Na+:H+ antiporter subunit F|nr:monovalent cation/H+ antiporter complex subunit F [Anaerolineae bacterium]